MARKKTNTVQGETQVATVTKSKGKAAKNEATKLNVVDKVELKPSQLVLVDKFMSTRQERKEQDIINLADSLRVYGQQQALQVRKNGESYEVVFGNTRKLAGDLIENGYKTVNGDGQEKELPANAEFTLRCEVVDISEEEAFINNIVENAQRQQLDPVSNAKNQQSLRDQGMSDAAITRVYGYGHQATVTRLKELLNLEPEFLEIVSRGDMSQAAANHLWDSTEKEGKEARDAIYLLAVDHAGGNGGEGIGLSAMKKAVVAWKKSRAEQAATQTAAGVVLPASGAVVGAVPPTSPAGLSAEGNATADGPKAKQRTVKEIKDTLKELIGTTDAPKHMVDGCQTFLNFIDGKIDEQEFMTYLYQNLKFIEAPIPDDAGEPKEVE